MARFLFFIFLLIHLALAQKAPPKWQTLTGESPVVIARGGFSGIFPDSSQYAYQLAKATSVPDVIFFCDLQLSKDGNGICLSDITLDNSTNIALIFPRGQKTYNVNGQDVKGWFAVDFTGDELFANVTLTQNIFSRSNAFDDVLPISMVEDVIGLKPSKFWVNVQYSMFYTEHKLNVEAYLQRASTHMVINYISSPEIGFLKSLNGKPNKGRPKYIFRFLEADAVEPTTKQTYSKILENLSLIKSFASGILVPKSYIWPVNAQQYLEAHTSLVADAHKLGLEVYAYGFSNDMPASFNYSYDPTAEYLQFVDNSEFSVDGVLTDYPPTASEAIACLAHSAKNTKPSPGIPLIITHNGASGVFAACTDLAYQQAVDDGADIIDCSVQMSKDGMPFCSGSPDLMASTTAMTTFMTRSAKIPQIQPKAGIFSFDLTWSEIQTLKPQLTSPIAEAGLARNPANKNKGKFVTLAEFLEFAKAKAVSGILINIENAAYLASQKGLSITDAVSTALSNATFDKQATQKVLIQSDDSSVLSKFKNVPAYDKVLIIKDAISEAPKPTVEEIKKYANAVNLPRSSIVKTLGSFTTSFTDVVGQMQAANISVYVSVLRNEYLTIAFDFFSDPFVEIATYIAGIGVNGIVTEYPATASAYKRSPCSNPEANLPYTILPASPGSLVSVATPEALPPAEAPAPPLNMTEIVDPPLPPVSNTTTSSSSVPTVAGPTGTPQPSGQPTNVANVGLCLIAIMVLSLMSLGY